MVFDAAPSAEERRYKQDRFTKSELTRVLEAMDDWHAAINLRHKIAKAEGWADSPPSLAVFVASALDEPNLLRRPLIQHGERVIYSRDEDEIRAFLA